MDIELSKMLKNLIPCIEGKWFVGDGALLGLIRDGKLLDFDDDIDIFILPETKINWDKLPANLKYYKDYICYKVYDRHRQRAQISDWSRYVSYCRILPEHRGKNRAELLQAAATTYREEKIEMEYTMPWIDIFILEKDVEYDGQYNVPYYFSKDRHDYYTKENLELVENYDLDYKIYIPNKAEEVLARQYGSSYMIENKDFKY